MIVHDIVGVEPARVNAFPLTDYDWGTHHDINRYSDRNIRYIGTTDTYSDRN